MKTRILLLLVAAAMIALGMWNISRRGTRRVVPPAGATAVDASKVEVPIKNGATIDFSSGKPVVKDTPAEKTKIDRSVTEMTKATSDVTFPPKPAAEPATPAPEKKE